MSQRPHKKLNVWKESIELVKDIYKVTRKFPKDEQFGMISQMRRASVSVPVNIGEGAARKSNKEYNQFLYIADGSLSELDTLLIISLELEFISKTEFESLISKLEKNSAMLAGLINHVESKI